MGNTIVFWFLENLVYDANPLIYSPLSVIILIPLPWVVYCPPPPQCLLPPTYPPHPHM